MGVLIGPFGVVMGPVVGLGLPLAELRGERAPSSADALPTPVEEGRRRRSEQLARARAAKAAKRAQRSS